jgi:hypothetical protein
MRAYNIMRALSFLVIVLLAARCNSPSPKKEIKTSNSYEDLVSFFKAWREFESPELKHGVPDYSAEAMAKQHKELSDWQQRLNAFDTTNWPIKHQVDWYLVWAEMNGLDFEHRVKQPWVKDPAFYVWFYPSLPDTPLREGPHVFARVELPDYATPLTDTSALEIAARLRNASTLYTQAKINLKGNAKDQWITGVRSIREQSEELETFAVSVEKTFPDLAKAALEARDASNEFATWAAGQSTSKTGPSGVGIENYTWNLKNVHLVPYTYQDEKILMERELARSHSALRFAEHRNRKLPMLTKKDNAKDYEAMLLKGTEDYLNFMEKEEFYTVKPYMKPALLAQIRPFVPNHGLRGFFDEVDYRDPMPMRAHFNHWIDLARNRYEPYESEIRNTPLLSNVFDSRAEGMATAMEELIMNAGMLEDRPRAKELVYIMLAQRAARGLAGLKQHGLELDFDGATKYASKWVPWGLMESDGSTIQHEEQFYIQQPGYETSYVIGKLDIDKLIAEYARQREGKFILKEFIDSFNRRGLIPVSLIYWEMTGDKSMLNGAVLSK